MNEQKVIEVLEDIRVQLHHQFPEIEPLSNTSVEFYDPDRGIPHLEDSLEIQIAHIKSMLIEIKERRMILNAYSNSTDCCELINEIPEREKLMRWFGFIQGVLWTAGIYTIDQMREINRI